jgi:hypothetical protein
MTDSEPGTLRWPEVRISTDEAQDGYLIKAETRCLKGHVHERYEHFSIQELIQAGSPQPWTMQAIDDLAADVKECK